MPTARQSQISLSDTPYYHCISRCVRRAFLCGQDHASGQCYEHRRQWIEDKLYELSGLFAIDLCAYAVMSNHYHVVLHVDIEEAARWSRDDIIDRWHRLFSGTVQSRRYTSNHLMTAAEREVLDTCVETWRSRLTDISWYCKPPLE